MSIDFFEIVLPKPVLSVTVAGLEGLRVPGSDAMGFWISGKVASWPLLCNRAFGGFSGNLLRETMGKDSLRFELAGTAASEFELARTVSAIPGRVLPAESGRSGSFVLRLGGASSEKSGRSIGRTGARARTPGVLGRDAGPRLRPFVAGTRPTEGERPVTRAGAGAGARRVGVDGREVERATEEFEFEFELEGIWGRAVGVELFKGRVLSPGEPGVGRVLAGVDGRDRTELVVGVGLEVDREVERLPGVDGLEVTEAELVLRTDVLLLLEK